MSKVYILWRSHGSYEDATTDPVRGYESEAKALADLETIRTFYRGRVLPEYDDRTTGFRPRKGFRREWTCKIDTEAFEASIRHGEIPTWTVAALEVVDATVQEGK